MSITQKEILDLIEEADTLVETEKLKSDVPLTEQGIDSLDMANVYLLMEETFNIKIPNEDLSELQTIEQIMNYVNNKRG